MFVTQTYNLIAGIGSDTGNVAQNADRAGEGLCSLPASARPRLLVTAKLLMLAFSIVVAGHLFVSPLKAEQLGDDRAAGPSEFMSEGNSRAAVLPPLERRELAPLPEGALVLKPGDMKPEVKDELSNGADGSVEQTSVTLLRALEDYRAQRIEKAIKGFELAAEKHSFIARYLLAHIYRTGKGGNVDHRRAYEYYLQITEEFSDGEIYHNRKAPYVAHAFVQLARYMELGVEELHIKSNPRMARMLFEKAAHYGDIEGQYQLGRFLIETGSMRNIKLGQRWLTRAAMRNNPKAQAYLGALYWQGDLISRKQSLALAWIEFARRNSSGTTKKQVERLYSAVKFDTSVEDQDRAQFYIGRLRSKYNVLWREQPRKANDDDELLDGIILAEPPKELDQQQLEAKAPHNQLPEVGVPGPEGLLDGATGGFGYQMFDYGGAGR